MGGEAASTWELLAYEAAQDAGVKNNDDQVEQGVVTIMLLLHFDEELSKYMSKFTATDSWFFNLEADQHAPLQAVSVPLTNQNERQNTPHSSSELNQKG